MSDEALTRKQVRTIRKQLAAGEITPEDAAEQGFPPSAPTKEQRR